MRLLLLPCFALVLASAQETFVIRKAVFSSRQLFWPSLEKDAKASLRKARQEPSTRIGVLPITVRKYQESIPCDSCHRLSANGMEFFLENYLTDRLRTRFPAQSVELIAPHFSLLGAGKIDLTAYLDSLPLPWDAWFAGGDDAELIYRPKDRLTSPLSRRRLDKLGGILGMGYLLLPTQVEVKVFPERSDTHKGTLEWSFRLMFWNVAAGRPEWSLLFSEKVESMDLDQSLEGHLDKSLVAAWDRLPADLRTLWKAEPH